MRLQSLIIARDAHTAVDTAVPEWEVPVLMVEHGEGKITLGAIQVLDRELPDPKSEFERLGAKYGMAAEGSEQKVENVFGKGAMGIRVLGTLIEQSAELERAAEANAAAEAEKLESAKLEAQKAEDARVEARAQQIVAERDAKAAKEVAELVGEPAKGSGVLGLNKK